MVDQASHFPHPSQFIQHKSGVPVPKASIGSFAPSFPASGTSRINPSGPTFVPPVQKHGILPFGPQYPQVVLPSANPAAIRSTPTFGLPAAKPGFVPQPMFVQKLDMKPPSFPFFQQSSPIEIPVNIQAAAQPRPEMPPSNPPIPVLVFRKPEEIGSHPEESKAVPVLPNGPVVPGDTEKVQRFTPINMGANKKTELKRGLVDLAKKGTDFRTEVWEKSKTPTQSIGKKPAHSREVPQTSYTSALLGSGSNIGAVQGGVQQASGVMGQTGAQQRTGDVKPRGRPVQVDINPHPQNVAKSPTPPFYFKVVDHGTKPGQLPASPELQSPRVVRGSPPIAPPPPQTGFPAPMLVGLLGKQSRGDNMFSKDSERKQMAATQAQLRVAQSDGLNLMQKQTPQFPKDTTPQPSFQSSVESSVGALPKPAMGQPGATKIGARLTPFVPQEGKQLPPALTPIVVRPEEGKQPLPIPPAAGKAGIGFDLPKMPPQIANKDGVPQVKFGQPPPMVPPSVYKPGERDVRPSVLFLSKTPARITRTCQICGIQKDEDSLYTDVPCQRKCIICKVCMHSKAINTQKCPGCQRKIVDDEIQMIRVYAESIQASK